MGNIFTLNFWFNMRPGPFQPGFQKIFLIMLVVFLVFSIIFYILPRKKKTIYNYIIRKLSSFFMINAIIGAFLLFFNYEYTYLLSAHFWLLLWLIGMVVWLVLIFRRFKEIPKLRREKEEKEEFNKYIP